MLSIIQTFRFDSDDRVQFRVGRFVTGEPYACITVGKLDLQLELPELIALRAATGEALIDLKAQTATLTADEDGHSLRADQHDREQESAA